MQAFYGTEISPHISSTPEGFLVCHDAPLCRTATRVPQPYRGSEVGLRTSEVVDVYRSPKEVLSAKFLASLEGKPICDQHPSQFLNPENVNWFQKGHVQNVRVGPDLANGERAVVGDLVVTDAKLIHKIKSGVRDLSVGYDCQYVHNGDGTYSQVKLRANHVAVVPDGRAGKDVAIMDHKSDHKAKDGLLDDMIPKPPSFDKLATELHEKYNPENEDEDLIVKKTKDDDEFNDEFKELVLTAIQKLTEAVEELKESRRRRVEPEEEDEMEVATDAHPSLLKLRQLRPLIAASGDQEAIANYNRAIKALKKMPRHLIPAEDSQQFRDILRGSDRTPQLSEFNAPHAEDAYARNDDENWGKRVNRMGAKIRSGDLRPDKTVESAQDGGESFVDICKRRRRELRGE